MNFWIIFLTGLTTGGLTCLAVQGGLLATVLARQTPAPPSSTGHKRRAAAKPQLPANPWPVIYFLAAKLLAYTLLGFLLGALGSALRLTPTVSAIMQITAGLFMLATALNMLDVHPIFRYVAIQPPKALTRLVRNQSKSEAVFAPALLGLFTVFIPCGTTQAMIALAITTGSPILGALVLFTFVLGTSPTFLVLGFLASQLRGRFKTAFGTAAVLLLLVLSVVSIDGGLTVLGAPFAPSRIIASLTNPYGEQPSGPPTYARIVDGAQELTIYATNYDYSPNNFVVQSGSPIRLRMITDDTYACTRAFTIPSLGIMEILPMTGEVLIDLPAQQPGSVFFTCSMGMFTGTITVY